jgi:hypothetical protein
MMWGLLIILAGSPMPQPITWHMSQEACHQQAAVEVMHAVATGREVAYVECRSYVVLPGRSPARTEVQR